MSDPKVDEAKLIELHSLTIDELIDRIKTKQATSGDLAVARALLNDNNINMDGTKKKSAPVRRLASLLPFKDPAETMSG